MADDLEKFADGLMHEALSEAAHTFFGTRRELEREIDLYREAVKRLAGVERAMLRRAGALHYLLLDGEAVRDFYHAVGAPPSHLPDAAEPDKAGLRKSWAFTGRGRYGKLLLAAYAALCEAAEEYTHGRVYKDPKGSGRRMVTVHYLQMRDWCHSLNARIEEVNRSLTPSGALCFIRNLDPVGQERAKVAGATVFGPECGLDRDLAFAPIECVAMTYVAAPALPPPAKAKAAILRFAAALHRARRRELDALLAAW